MDINNLPHVRPAVTDVYTDLNGLQSLKNESDDVAIRKVAQQFESLFINMMMKSMRSANAVFEKDGLFNDSQEAGFYRDMHDQQMSLSMSHGKGIGIADALYRQMSRAQGVTPTSELDTSIASATPVQFDRRSPLSTSALKDFLALSSAAKNGAGMVSAEHKAIRTEVDNANKNRSEAVSIASDTRVSIAQTAQEFIQKIANYAKSAAEKIGVDPNVLVAQAALETGWGRFVLADAEGNSGNNLFNIKADDRWAGGAVEKSSLEFNGKTLELEKSYFRTYNDLAESFDDYADFLRGSERYAPALNVAGDGEAYIRSLQKSGYATDPDYAKKIITIYRDLNTSSLSGQDRNGEVDRG